MANHKREARIIADIASRRLEISKGIAEGERAVKEGRIFTQAEARKRLARWMPRSGER